MLIVSINLMTFIINKIKWIALIVFLLINSAAKAELIKGKTIGYSSIGGEAIIELSDSARVFPYEPGYGEWRLVMWVGYVDTSQIINNATTKPNSVGYDNIDFTPKCILLKAAQLFSAQGFYNPLAQKKLVAIYAYIPEKSIREESKVEPRLEKVLKTKKKKRWQAFEALKKDFGFIDAILIQDKVTLHFLYDQRSPEGANDYRLLVFSNAKKEIIAVAHEGYRKLKLKSKSEQSLDRKLTIYFLKKISKEEQQEIIETFTTNYRYRDY